MLPAIKQVRGEKLDKQVLLQNHLSGKVCGARLLDPLVQPQRFKIQTQECTFKPT